MRDAKPVLLPQITQIVLFLPGFTGSIPLYYVYFGAAFRHHLPQWGFWAQILWFWPPRVSPGTSEPAKSSLRAESRDLLNINHPKMGCRCQGACGEEGSESRMGSAWGLDFAGKKPRFQACQSCGGGPGAKLCTQQLPGGIKPPGEGKLMDYHRAPAPVGQGAIPLSQRIVQLEEPGASPGAGVRRLQHPPPLFAPLGISGGDAWGQETWGPRVSHHLSHHLSAGAAGRDEVVPHVTAKGEGHRVQSCRQRSGGTCAEDLHAPINTEPWQIFPPLPPKKHAKTCLPSKKHSGCCSRSCPLGAPRVFPLPPPPAHPSHAGSQRTLTWRWPWP